MTEHGSGMRQLDEQRMQKHKPRAEATHPVAHHPPAGAHRQLPRVSGGAI